MVFHGVICIFQSNHGTGTSYIKGKLLQQIYVMHKVVIYDIFLYHHKTYNAMNCWLFLKILEGYGVVPRTLQLIQKYR